MRLFVLAILLVGCVPKKKYDILELELGDTRGLVERHEARIAELESALSQTESDAAKARTEHAAALADLEAELAELKAASSAREAELLAEKAALVKDRSALKGSIEEMEAALAELERRKAAVERRVAEFKDLLSRFESLIDSGRLRVKIVDGRMVVEMGTDILFASGRAALSDEGKTALLEVAGVLADIDKSYQIEGHTDNVPIKTDRFPSNWELASARAITVERTLVEGGISEDRLSAAAYADLKPVADNETDEGRAANRRIEIVVVPDLSQLPGFEELRAVAEGEE